MQNPVPAVQNSDPADRPAGQPTDQLVNQAAAQPSESGNLLLRNDTILGVCEAIGRDFGFNPNFLRIPRAGGVLLSPIAAVGIYFALGIAVLASRLLFPAPRRLAAAPQSAASPATSQRAENETQEVQLAA
ncbi:MAG TPA: PspC domain-containing protein [Sphingomicrobium sp.]